MIQAPPRRACVFLPMSVLALLCLIPTDAAAHLPLEKVIATDRRTALRPLDAPDISGSGKVTRVGNIWLKSTNIGVIGNPYTAISGDPSCQWPGPSGVEYLFYVGLWVGAVDPSTVDPIRRRRVSATTEWRPRSAG